MQSRVGRIGASEIAGLVKDTIFDAINDYENIIEGFSDEDKRELSALLQNIQDMGQNEWGYVYLPTAYSISKKMSLNEDSLDSLNIFNAKQDKNNAMERGHLLENQVKDRFLEIMKLDGRQFTIIEEQTVKHYNNDNRFIATIDLIAHDDNQKKVIVELKTKDINKLYENIDFKDVEFAENIEKAVEMSNNLIKGSEKIEGIIPFEYYIQTQAQMLINEIDECYICLCGSISLHEKQRGKKTISTHGLTNAYEIQKIQANPIMQILITMVIEKFFKDISEQKIFIKNVKNSNDKRIDEFLENDIENIFNKVDNFEFQDELNDYVQADKEITKLQLRLKKIQDIIDLKISSHVAKQVAFENVVMQLASEKSSNIMFSSGSHQVKCSWDFGKWRTQEDIDKMIAKKKYELRNLMNTKPSYSKEGRLKITIEEIN